MNTSLFYNFFVTFNDIPTAILIKLARFHNTSIDYLLGETNQKKRYP